MRYNLDLSNQKKKMFCKKLDIIDMVFYIIEKDYKSIYTRDHLYQIRFNKKLYEFKSKSAVKEFQINMNFDYTIKILELDEIYQDVFAFYRKSAPSFGIQQKNKVMNAITNLEYQFKYFGVNRYSVNYNYYVVTQVNKIIDQLKEILILINKQIRNVDKVRLYVLFDRLNKLEKLQESAK